MYDLLVESARIVRPEGSFEATLGVEDGRISYIGDAPSGLARVHVDGRGLWLLPGLVDAHVHFRDPGHSLKEDWASGSAAAAVGGVTTVCDMPNTHPPTIDLATWHDKDARARVQSRVDYAIWAGATAGNCSVLRDLIDQKLACGIKVFMGATTGPLLVDDATLVELFEQTHGLLGVHAEDEGVLAQERLRWKDVVDPEHHLVRPPEAAVAAVRRLLDLIRETKREVHICHLSTAAELALLDREGQNLPVSVEVCPHHLYLSSEDRLGNWMKCNPPVRSPEDQAALWAALHAGRLHTVGSDHAPHTRAEKMRPYWEAPSGIPGVETTLRLLMGSVASGQLAMETVAAMGAEAPARRFALKGKGRIEVGYDADFMLLDPPFLTPLLEETLQTRVGWSPFSGRLMGPFPRAVYRRGELVAAQGKVLALPGSGRRVPLL